MFLTQWGLLLEIPSVSTNSTGFDLDMRRLVLARVTALAH